MEIILFQPEIPQNTGNIVRTCAVTGSSLTLVRPLGFSTSDRQLKRAGLDYWLGVPIIFVDSLTQYMENKNVPIYFLSSKAAKTYDTIPFTSDCCLVFGSETKGLPQEFHIKWHQDFYTVPMVNGQRCLNLASTVSVVLYEGWRQMGFK